MKRPVVQYGINITTSIRIKIPAFATGLNKQQSHLPHAFLSCYFVALLAKFAFVVVILPRTVAVPAALLSKPFQCAANEKF